MKAPEEADDEDKCKWCQVATWAWIILVLAFFAMLMGTCVDITARANGCRVKPSGQIVCEGNPTNCRIKPDGRIVCV